MAEYLDISKGTANHHLSTLEEFKYVTKGGKNYRLGLRLFELGESTRRESDVYTVAKNGIGELAAEIGEWAT